jgi:dolichol-phosphate mannosyltransferase
MEFNMGMPVIAAVVPAHNEGAALPTLVAEIAAALSPLGAFEILIVDDGSQDDSLKILEGLFPRYPMLRIIRHAQSCGQSRALISGIWAACAPLIVTLDGDGQNIPADIPKLYARYQELAAQETVKRPILVAGWRQLRLGDSRWRRWQSLWANRMRAWILQDGTPDTGCGLKIFERQEFLFLPAFTHMHRFLPALFQARGGGVYSVPVAHRQRHGGRSHYGMWGRFVAGLIDVLAVRWLIWRTHVPQFLPELPKKP